ncbi:hypothetical protein O181_001678 [Austropuccinia psidii MF-1]|uniref:Uncharacterized protein n=1 Tax=Austropuccinia psidii MF-1 TaxID=1389203 RepID=A0A9Q3GBY0_9BASI|nr:hypothetical protein [Austropuccinia psidii MF-1]
MHNLILRILKDHATLKLCIPESKSKIYLRTCKKSNDTNSSDSDSMTSNRSIDQITLREALSLRRDAAESLPTTSQCPPLTCNIHLVVLWRFPHLMRITSTSPLLNASELDLSALTDHQVKGEALENLRQIIFDTMIPSSWTSVPGKMGSPSHGSLKAAEWALLYKV